jgi:UDP-glucose 4-epimerase
MKLLITGIAGFIGSKIAQAAIQEGHEVIGVDDHSQGYRKNIPGRCHFLQLDLTCKTADSFLPKNIDVILHLAGQSSGEISFSNPREDLAKNTISTLNLINYGIKAKARKIVYASSMSVYGATEDTPIPESHPCSPLSCYGVGKLAAENYLKVYHDQLPFIAFRMFNVFGPGQDLQNLRQGMVSIYVAHGLLNSYIPVKGDLNRFRDFIFIDDVVRIWLQSIYREDIHNQIFNLGTGIRTTVRDLLFQIKELLPNVSWSQKLSTLGDQFGVYADTKLLESYFNVSSFTSLQNGLNLLIQWAKKEIQK